MANHISTAGSDQYCSFLELPGELRNAIYSYALREPAGLRFRQDDYGVGRLEITSLAVPSTPTVYFATCKTENIVKREIAKAALGAANQLQYVNHELRKETRGLGIRCNDLSFDKLRDLLSFISICPNTETQYLRKLRLQDALYTTYGGPYVDLLQPDERHTQILQFCEANPGLIVESYIKGWGQTHTMFVPYAMLVEMQFRKTNNRVPDFFTDPGCWPLVEGVTKRKLANAGQGTPANLKFFPGDKVFDEEAFRTSALGIANFFGPGDFNRIVEGGVDRWVPLVKNIYDEGI